MPQKQPPARTAVCWPLVGARGTSTEGFGIATAPPAALQEAPRPSGRTAARIAKARTTNRSMSTLLSKRLYRHSFLSNTISPRQKRTGNPSQGFGIKCACPTKSRQRCQPLYSRWLAGLGGGRGLDAVNDFFHDLFGHFAADRALRIIHTALRESQGASAGAALGVQAMQGGLLLRWRQSSEIYPRQFGGVHRILQEYLACVRESLYASLDRKAEERTDFEDVGVDRMQASMLPHDAPLRIDHKGGRQGRNAAIRRDYIRCGHDDRIVDSPMLCETPDLRRSVVVFGNADNLKLILELPLQ